MASQSEATPLEASAAQPGALPPDELFQIIDETGQGFGFDLTPDALAKPLALATAGLFSLGMLAGIPFGLAMGRSDEASGSKGVLRQQAATAGGEAANATGARTIRPSLDGVKFAASAFGLGTLLCASAGVASFYAVKHHYGVESFEEFGKIMRQDVVPRHRTQIESRVNPWLDSVRHSATDNLPEPVMRLRDHFAQTRFARWLKSNIDLSISDPSLEEPQQPNEQTQQHEP